MAKCLDKFSKPFRDSRIPFMLAEVITNGEGEMVDLVCQFTNGAAAALDSMEISSMVGSLAGDDTVLLIMRSNEDAAVLCEEIKEMLG